MGLYSEGGQFGGMYANPSMEPKMAAAQNPWMDMFNKIFGGLGTPGQNPYSDQFNKYLGGAQITPAQLGVNPMDVVKSYQPLIQEQQNIGFANAGKRFGSQGMLMSTPYSQALGGVARKSASDTANIYNTYLGGAAENQANRALQAALGNQQASLRSAELVQGQANPWFNLAGQMAGLGQQESQFGRSQAQQQGQFEQSQGQQQGQFQQSLQQQKDQLAQQMGLDYAQLNQQQKQFVDNQVLQREQMSQQNTQFGQQQQQDWFSKFYQWIMQGGDPGTFNTATGQNIKV